MVTSTRQQEQLAKGSLFNTILLGLPKNAVNMSEQLSCSAKPNDCTESVAMLSSACYAPVWHSLQHNELIAKLNTESLHIHCFYYPYHYGMAISK